MIFHGTFFKSIINRHHHQTSPVVTEYVPGKLGFGQSVCCKMFAVCWKMWHDKRNLLRWTVNSGQGGMTWLKVDSADSADQKKAYQRKSSALQWNARVSTFKPHWIWQQANNQWGSSQVKMDNTLFRLTLRHWVNFLEKADSWTQREQTYPIHSMIPQPTYSIPHPCRDWAPLSRGGTAPQATPQESLAMPKWMKSSPYFWKTKYSNFRGHVDVCTVKYSINMKGKSDKLIFDDTPPSWICFFKLALPGFHKRFGWLLWTHEFTLFRI